jgi:hypothetical protein
VKELSQHKGLSLFAAGITRLPKMVTSFTDSLIYQIKLIGSFWLTCL